MCKYIGNENWEKDKVGEGEGKGEGFVPVPVPPVKATTSCIRTASTTHKMATIAAGNIIFQPNFYDQEGKDMDGESGIVKKEMSVGERAVLYRSFQAEIRKKNLMRHHRLVSDHPNDIRNVECQETKSQHVSRVADHVFVRFIDIHRQHARRVSYPCLSRTRGGLRHGAAKLAILHFCARMVQTTNVFVRRG